jgi:hypothetical protein
METYRRLHPYLGCRGDAVAAGVASRVRLRIENQVDRLQLKRTYDFLSGDSYDLITFQLALCPCCGKPHASRLEVVTVRNYGGKPYEATFGKDWDQEVCRVCHEAALNRERLARYRERHRQEKVPIACATCGSSFTPQRSTACFCSAKCRVAAHRAKAVAS